MVQCAKGHDTVEMIYQGQFYTGSYNPAANPTYNPYDNNPPKGMFSRVIAEKYWCPTCGHALYLWVGLEHSWGETEYFSNKRPLP